APRLPPPARSRPRRPPPPPPPPPRPRAWARTGRARAAGLVPAGRRGARDLLRAHAGAPAALFVNADRAGELAREAPRWTLDELLRAVALCREARLALAHNVTPRLTLEMLLSRFALRAA